MFIFEHRYLLRDGGGSRSKRPINSGIHCYLLKTHLQWNSVSPATPEPSVRPMHLGLNNPYSKHYKGHLGGSSLLNLKWLPTLTTSASPALATTA
jgi:hypothetical protein